MGWKMYIGDDDSDAQKKLATSSTHADWQYFPPNTTNVYQKDGDMNTHIYLHGSMYQPVLTGTWNYVVLFGGYYD
ncbi:hypothetical protein C3709_11965 [Lelliottia aquatilis]|uniref:Uncharacterized protein n=1 Tax=Lelliottia aquatilis TaxID=2080838 RepID=A0ABX4ZXS3_9ENTR|nr:hypothetical protein C3708_20090 [Lelliottia sp. 7254-16]POZ20539.1 hypothetical protein C3712_18155 [Lelliottia aquatilis]POZ22046.1 hypothetical protein C3711_18900 [Lelliottia aquatilis]POZ33108.1 hypothetical protein C3710_10190 [Lelliottia aquatilis]POZ38248.1 hypothetical protein C3709_11965 [Lelliottia aquatilis]